MATTTRGRRKDTTSPAESATPVPSDPTPADDSGTPAGPEPAAPVNGRPTSARDRMKVTLVGEILGEHPDGIPANDLVTASELQPAVVARVLTAMEATGAAYRKVDDSGAETWYQGDGDLSAVDLASAPTDSVCPTCKRPGWRVNLGGTRRRSGGNGEPRINSDGSQPLAKGALTEMVRDFLHDRPGEGFTDGEIARKLGESHGRTISAGAVRDNLHKMLGKEIRSANPDDPHDKRVTWAG